MNELHAYMLSLSASEREEFAARCETTVGYLMKAIYAKQRIGEKTCINIERESNRIVTCDMLRQDVDWAYLRRTCKRKAA